MGLGAIIEKREGVNNGAFERLLIAVREKERGGILFVYVPFLFLFLALSLSFAFLPFGYFLTFSLRAFDFLIFTFYSFYIQLTSLARSSY